MKENRSRINWHEGFVSAMKLDLIENADDLQYEQEYYLTGKHQRIDLLIIKNENLAIIRNPIGAGFSKYNICEYKSPDDSLTYGDFFKTLAYTGLFLDECEKHGNYKISDYTMTFVKESRPYKLFRRLTEDGISITPAVPGIYSLENRLPFATQIIVTSEISDSECPWLRCLTKRGTRQNLDNSITITPALTKNYKDEADTVMDIFTSANNEFVAKQIKEEPKMCKAVDELFSEIFADEINAMKAEIADKDSLLADKDALIAQLQAKLDEYAKMAAKPQS